MQYVICGYEKEERVGELLLFLIDNIKLEQGSSRSYQPYTDSYPDIDVRSPIYPIRGQLHYLYDRPALLK